MSRGNTLSFAYVYRCRRTDLKVSAEPSVKIEGSRDVPAVCISIDRFHKNRAPIRCLPFDGIGAQHLGVTHGARARCPLHYSLPTLRPQGIRKNVPELIMGHLRPHRLKFNWENQAGDLPRSTCEPADAGMPECRAPIPSKGKHRIGALFLWERSIETQTAVT